MEGILKFALPLLAGSLFQQLYTTADGIIVGRFAGASALAAIDGVYSLTKLPVNFLTGLSSRGPRSSWRSTLAPGKQKRYGKERMPHLCWL